MTVSTGLEYTLGAVLGVAVGALGGFAGIGGAPFIVAGLTLMIGYEQHMAQGTTVAVMLGPMSLPGVIVMWDRCKLSWKYIAVGVVTYTTCSYVGAVLSYLFNADAMSQLFGIFILILGIRNMWRAFANSLCPPDTMEDESEENDKSFKKIQMSLMDGEEDGKDVLATEAEDVTNPDVVSPNTVVVDVPLNDENNDDTIPRRRTSSVHSVHALTEQTSLPANELDFPDEEELKEHESEMNPNGLTIVQEGKPEFTLVTAAILGCVVGCVGGLFGIGAGVLMVPLLTGVWGIHKDDARAISLGILCPPVSLGAVIQYQMEGDIQWGMVGLQFVCYVVCNYFGAKLGKRVDGSCFNKFLGSMLAVLGILLIIMASLDCDGWCM